MEQRKEFLEAAMRGEHSFTELCRRYSISRKKWLQVAQPPSHRARSTRRHDILR
jgi:hypothetical protein